MKNKKISICIYLIVFFTFIFYYQFGMATGVRAEAPVDQIQRTAKFIEEYLDSLIS